MYSFHNDDEDDLDNHHPTCRGGCGQLADECMCWYLRRERLRKQKEYARLDSVTRR